MRQLSVFLLAMAVISAGVITHATGQTTYVYVSDYNGSGMAGFSMNPSTGLLTSVPGSPFPAGALPAYPAVDRGCRFAYVGNQSSNNVSAYTIDASTGQLNQTSNSPFAAGIQPTGTAIDRLGKFLYVGSADGLYAFTIDGEFGDATGNLSPIPGSPFTAGSHPVSATIDPSNRFLYVGNDSSGDVSGFTIDPTTGELSAIPGSPWPSGSLPRALQTDITGRFLYVSNTSSGNISIFNIDPNTGALSQVNGSPVFVAGNIYNIAIDATNTFLYVGQNSGGVYGFMINNSTGMLTPLPNFPFIPASPPNSAGIATDPSRKFLIVANAGFTNTVSILRINSQSGALTQVPGSPFPGRDSPVNPASCTTVDSDSGLAKLIGGNTFTGNQTINGTLAATAFSGDGSGLINLNASNLGGIAAGSYARLDVGNAFTGNQSITGNLSTTGTTIIGGGTPIVEHLSMTFNPSFPAVKASSCVSANFTFTGASDGDTLALGVPNARTTGGGTIAYFAWVSASNTITIQACNIGQSPQKTPGSGAIRVDDWKH